MKIVLSLLLLLLTTMLAGCAAPAPASAASERAAADAANQPEPRKHRPPPMSDPYPPRQAKPGVALDFSCASSADCKVKDVGNCCGAMPACVNKDSPTDPAAVRAQCEASGMMGICGFQEISTCQCVSGRCEPQSTVLTDGPPAR